ncbi:MULTISPECIES: GIY-YIG nuclease family protein [Aneurinibacillus]|jgi:Uri superfamily endonuclease|uniref:GIY-YIG domain-containing protein n=1 Tax=Aneurinibacillus danicus TaxID=267746 RepID=A0A511V5V0_9BACL|nr:MULTISPECIES: GIY-YIG nuclease family protein [Aneurinibacillus]GEN33501.1 hypothetical protein ADA01nite_09610 [Aneurinibacillus danicus]
MEWKVNPKHTLYSIEMYLPETVKITVGRLGTFIFSAGIYIYVGSAKRNIEARINRHIRKEKPLRWHLDYLRPYAEITEVCTYSGKEGECGLFARLLEEKQGAIPVRGFGSSDCRCPAHLFYC